MAMDDILGLGEEKERVEHAYAVHARNAKQTDADGHTFVCILLLHGDD